MKTVAQILDVSSVFAPQNVDGAWIENKMSFQQVGLGSSVFHKKPAQRMRGGDGDECYVGG